MAELRVRMQEYLVNWRNDLADPWTPFFDDCPPLGFLGIPEALQIDDGALVWPDRKPPGNGALAASHICRAFDGIAPDNVRVVVLGQDPYPSRAQATGRAFEDGNWDGRTESLGRSLKPLMLAAMATQEDHGDLFRAGSWPEVRRRVENEALLLPDLGSYFDLLERQGVLFVNAAWTHTRKNDVNSHLAIWVPVIQYFLQKLARDAEHPLAFLLLGKKAQAIFDASGAQGNHIVRIDLAHPRHATIFQQNPWLTVNDALGADPIVWWPPPRDEGV